MNDQRVMQPQPVELFMPLADDLEFVDPGFMGVNAQMQLVPATDGRCLRIVGYCENGHNRAGDGDDVRLLTNYYLGIENDPEHPVSSSDISEPASSAYLAGPNLVSAQPTNPDSSARKPSPPICWLEDGRVWVYVGK